MSARKEIDHDNIVDFIFDLFARHGEQEYIGEEVSMSQHMQQSAALAVADGADDTLVVATLLHDIGHFVSDYGPNAADDEIDNVHEEAGAAFLARYFPAEVTEPIRLHVPAKRYLCATDADYFNCLSAASVLSLKLQGGPMSDTEVANFAANPHHQAACQLRRYDDNGKVQGLDIKNVTAYRPQIEILLR